MTISPDRSHRRALPAQTRSAKTLDLILSAAAELLVDGGLPGFNTNAVARVAGINVATLYHYFPNKTAILRELFERYEGERLLWAAAPMDDLVATSDLRGWLTDTIDGVLSLRASQPGVAALRRACRAVPELVEVGEAISVAHAANLAGALVRLSPRLSPERAKTSSRVIIEVTAALLDYAAENPEMKRAMAEGLADMILGYLDRLGVQAARA